MAQRKASTTQKPPKTSPKNEELIDQKLVKALAHPLRVRLLAYFCDHPWSPSGLAKELDEGLSYVSYHVKVLKDLKLIELVRKEPRRGAVEHFYRSVHPLIIPEGLWSRLPKPARQRIWGDMLKELGGEVSKAIYAGTFDSRDDFHISLTPMHLDEEGWKALAQRTDAFLDDIFEIQAEVRSREVAAKESASIPAWVAIMAFESARDSEESEGASARRRG